MSIPVIRLVVATLDSFAPILTGDVARVVGESGAYSVRLPDVQFKAAGTVSSKTRVGVVLVGNPFVAVGLSIDPFEIVRTLRITVARSIGSSSLQNQTIHILGNEVNSPY